MSEKTIQSLTIAQLLSENSAGQDYPSSRQLFRIGDLAQEFGISLRTLRFYEDKGLLNPRRAGLTRLYSRDDYTRLRLILFGRRIGFTLTEIKQLIDLWRDGTTQFDALGATLRGKLHDLEQKRQEIDRTISELKTLLSWPTSSLT